MTEMAGRLNIRIAPMLAALVAAVLAALAFAGATPNQAFAAANPCPKADASPRGTTSDKLGEAVLCLLEKARRQAGLRTVDPVGSLKRVAEKHTDVMVKEDCLDHRCGDENPLKQRIVRSGYPIPGGRFGFGEITGCSRTPRSMVKAWLDSPVHRRRILDRKYRDIGVGAAKGKLNVGSCADGRLRGVYTVIFAWRKR